jgi:geranylgeranyl pyrophosphate synthase
VDDVLDFTGDQTSVGKPVGSDLLNGLVTLPGIYYAEAHPEDSDVQSLPQGGWTNVENMEHLVASIRKSGAIESAMHEAERYVEEALQRLKAFPEDLSGSPWKNYPAI